MEKKASADDCRLEWARDRRCRGPSTRHPRAEETRKWRTKNRSGRRRKLSALLIKVSLAGHPGHVTNWLTPPINRPLRDVTDKALITWPITRIATFRPRESPLDGGSHVTRWARRRPIMWRVCRPSSSSDENWFVFQIGSRRSHQVRQWWHHRQLAKILAMFFEKHEEMPVAATRKKH